MKEYLKRRNFLLENGIEKFIKQNFTDDNGHNYIIKRFFSKTPIDKMELEISSVITNWIKKKRPAPVLNPIISARLLDSAQELIKRSYLST